ncbi:MAG: metalloregulator ArsR/SmtB family transcription factor [Pseudomonadota bacterium]
MITKIGMDAVFHALSHSTRREILDLLAEQPGSPVGQVASHFDCSRIAVMNHLRVLEEAELVLSEKDGRARLLYLNVVPIQLIYDRWTDAYSGHWASKLTFIKQAAERKAKKRVKNE